MTGNLRKKRRSGPFIHNPIFCSTALERQPVLPICLLLIDLRLLGVQLHLINRLPLVVLLNLLDRLFRLWGWLLHVDDCRPRNPSARAETDQALLLVDMHMFEVPLVDVLDMARGG